MKRLYCSCVRNDHEEVTDESMCHRQAKLLFKHQSGVKDR